MFAILKRSRNSPNKSLANINEFTVYISNMQCTCQVYTYVWQTFDLMADLGDNST